MTNNDSAGFVSREEFLPSDRLESPVVLLSIAAVERDTGLSKDTLRVWERRYGFPSPGRDANQIAFRTAAFGRHQFGLDPPQQSRRASSAFRFNAPSAMTIPWPTKSSSGIIGDW